MKSRIKNFIGMCKMAWNLGVFKAKLSKVDACNCSDGYKCNICQLKKNMGVR